jgi:hypothetical protein
MSLQLTDGTIIELDDYGIDLVRKIHDRVITDNVDWFIVVVGGEGVGKSTLALAIYTLWCYLNKFSWKDMLLRTTVFDEDNFLKFLSTLNPLERYLPILLDEGANILFNRESMKKQRLYVLKFFNVMRFLNYLTVICTPNIKFIDKNVRYHRVKTILYVERRGVYWYYDRKQIEYMMKLESQKQWSWVEPSYTGTFGVNKEIEQLTTQLKQQYISNFSLQIKKHLATRSTSRSSLLRKQMDILGEDKTNRLTNQSAFKRAWEIVKQEKAQQEKEGKVASTSGMTEAEKPVMNLPPEKKEDEQK